MLTAVSILFGITAGILCSIVLLFGYKTKPVPMAIGLTALGCVPGTPFVPAALSFAFADGNWTQALWGAFMSASESVVAFIITLGVALVLQSYLKERRLI
jgi:hypothetical protein